MVSLFHDRRHAGRVLAASLENRLRQRDIVILALPRGGVPVAYEVARQLDAPLDVFLVRKLGVPGHEEYAMGAIASGGVIVLNEDVVQTLGIPRNAVDDIVRAEERELRRRELAYHETRPPVHVEGKTAILIDDGLATGSTMRAAIQALRRLNPARIIVAVPIASAETCQELSDEADEMVCTVTPEPFVAVGVWYEDFTQTTDEEVRELLAAAHRARDARQQETLRVHGA